MVGPGTEHGRGHDRTDPELLEQVGTPGRTIATIALRCSAASWVSTRKRRAKDRNASTVVLVSTSQDDCTRRPAAVASIPGSFCPRNLTRMGSGAAITRLNTCCWASVAACTAERRAASSTERAWRSPPLRGVPSRGRANASRAARIASRGSVFAPLRRLARLARSSSTTISPRPHRCRLRPAPWPPVPSIAQARKVACSSANSTKVASPSAVASTVISSRTPPVVALTTAAEWVWTWVSTPMTTSTTSARSVRLVMRSLLRRTGRGSGPGRRFGRTVMRHTGRC